MCHEAVDDCLAALKFVPDQFVTSEIIKKLSTAFYTDENILNFNKDSGSVICSCNGMGILNIDLNDINLDDTNFDEDGPDVYFIVRILDWHFKFEKRKTLIKS